MMESLLKSAAYEHVMSYFTLIQVLLTYEVYPNMLCQYPNMLCQFES